MGNHSVSEVPWCAVSLQMGAKCPRFPKDLTFGAAPTLGGTAVPQTLSTLGVSLLKRISKIRRIPVN